jgi:hypothetical protein
VSNEPLESACHAVNLVRAEQGDQIDGRLTEADVLARHNLSTIVCSCPLKPLTKRGGPEADRLAHLVRV